MKRIIAAGRVSAGKTTLARHPRGISLKGHKDADGRDSRTIDRHPGRIPRAPRILPGFGRPFGRGRGGSAAPILHRPPGRFSTRRQRNVCPASRRCRRQNRPCPDAGSDRNGPAATDGSGSRAGFSTQQRRRRRGSDPAYPTTEPFSNGTKRGGKGHAVLIGSCFLQTKTGIFRTPVF